MGKRTVILIIALTFCQLWASGQVQKKAFTPLDTLPSLLSARIFLGQTASISQLQMVAPNEILKHWGLFCKKEWEMEKTTGIPFRFRVGSLDHTDRLEGKSKYIPVDR